jgi:hypothetical protein
MYIYCNYKEKHKVLDLLGALLRQLAFHRLSSSSIELLQRERERQRQARPSLKTLTSVLETEIKTYSRVFIVVDALDEFYHEDDRRDLIEKLRLLAINSSAKLMTTSRRIDSIAHAIRADAELEITAMPCDIAAHIQARISTNTMLERLITKPASIKKEVVDTVIEKAQGM